MMVRVAGFLKGYAGTSVVLATKEREVLRRVFSYAYTGGEKKFGSDKIRTESAGLRASQLAGAAQLLGI